MNDQQTHTDETDDFDHSAESQGELFPCVKCGNRLGGDDLYCLKMSKLSRIKAKKAGTKSAFITPDDLPGFAFCWTCRDQDLIFETDFFTLASTVARSKADNERPRPNNGAASQKRDQQRPATRPAPSQAMVTEVELVEIVLCCACLTEDKVTTMERRDAVAPGWDGCRILDALRRHPQDLEMKDLVYLGSHELLKEGYNGFAHCARCIEPMMEILREKAVEIGFSEEVAEAKIQSWSLVAMIVGVRKKEEERASRRS